MIHDGFIYLATLMLLAAILVNLPCVPAGKRRTDHFFKFAPPIVLIYLGMMLLCTMKVGICRIRQPFTYQSKIRYSTAGCF